MLTNEEIEREMLKWVIDAEFGSSFHEYERNDLISGVRAVLAAAQAKPSTNQCGEACERAKLCAACARELGELKRAEPEGGQ